MRMAITSRRGPDTSPLVLEIEKSGWDKQPPVGCQVHASGNAGWRYEGIVTEVNPDGVHYTIRVTKVTNKWLEFSGGSITDPIQDDEPESSKQQPGEPPVEQ